MPQPRGCNDDGIQIVPHDKVSEVLDISQADIEEAPKYGGSLNKEMIIGIANVSDGIKILLDIDKLLSDSEKENAIARTEDKSESDSTIEQVNPAPSV